MIDLNHVSFEAATPIKRVRLTPEQNTQAVWAWKEQNCPREPHEELDDFLNWLLGTAVQDVRAYRTAPLQRRLTACLRKLRVKTAAEGLRLLQNKPQLRAGALDSALIGVSEFFRDAPVFSALTDVVLPQLREENDSIQVLSAGCSMGQELYSVAMLLSEAGMLDRCALKGIDCRPTAVAQARNGSFTCREITGIPQKLRRRYLEGRPDAWRVASQIRERMEWQVRDLMTLLADPSSQLVLFRNVAIYLDPKRAERTWEVMAAQVKRGGFLVTGSAEQPPQKMGFARVAPCVFRRP